MNIDKIRSEFPILKQKIYNKPLIYLDNAATTQKPQVVIDKMNEMYALWNSNVHRGVHFLSNYCTTEGEKARKKVADYIGASSTNEIIFTSGTTDAVNIVADSFCREYLSDGDEILVSQIEHHSNFVPWQQAAKRYGGRFQVFNIHDDGSFDLDDFKSKLSSKTKIVAVNHVSNALGNINPIETIVEAAHSLDIPVLVDGAQAVQHIPINVNKLDVDFYVFSGHKLYGPTGIGVLYGKEKWLEQIPPYRFGGEMIKKVINTHTTFNTLPFKFEAGTPNYIGQVGLGTAIDFVNEVGLTKIAHAEHVLLQHATSRLNDIEGVKIYGTQNSKTAVVSFLAYDIHPYDIGVILDKMGIAIRTGNHCTQPLFNRLGLEGTIRASFAFYNTIDEIDFFADSLKQVIDMLH